MATLKDLFENEDIKIYSHVETYSNSSFSELTERINIHMKAYGGGEEIFGPVSITYNPDVEKYIAMVTCYSREPIKTYLGGDLDMDSIKRSF